MLTYDEALKRILDHVTPGQPVPTLLLASLGLTLAEDVTAPNAIPPFANSAMDGYAVLASDLPDVSETNSIVLPISGQIAAGTAPVAFQSGTAARIMTGAPLPIGADTIVPFEDTADDSQGVRIQFIVEPKQYVRNAGEDVMPGTVVVTAGTRIRPAEVAMFAAIGRETVPTIPRPRVAIVSTGDELVMPGNTLTPGQIYNSNAFSLAAQVMEAGGIVTHQIHARDTQEDLRTAFDACTDVDLILTSGGVSVGDFDHVRSVFAERGTLDFWRIAIRPGKPLAFGTWENTLFVGLPGNPVSSMVTFELFVRPALRRMLGYTNVARPIVQAILEAEASHDVGRRDFQRVIVSRTENGRYTARPTGRQGSGMLRSMVLANGLLIIPEDVAMIPANQTGTVMLLDSL